MTSFQFSFFFFFSFTILLLFYSFDFQRMAGGFCVLSVSPAPWLACSPSLTHRHTHTCVSFSLSHPLSVTIPHSTQSMIWVTWFSSRALGPMQEGEKKDKKKKTEGRFYEGHPC